MTLRRLWIPKISDEFVAPKENSLCAIERFGLRASNLQGDWQTRLRRRVARDICHVHKLDATLGDISNPPFRMICVAQEMRPGRVIIGMDINSACGYAVAHEMVPDPKRLVEVDKSNHRLGQPGIAGYYKIAVGKPRGSLPAPWLPLTMPQHDTPHKCIMARHRDDDTYEVWIHHSEWSGWNAIWECEVLQAIEGPAIQHPLANIAAQLWTMREKGDPDAKTLLATMHTCMGPRKSSPNSKHADSIWSLHRMPMGWVRGEWLRKYHQMITAYPTALLCYANVDSQHWSIPASYWAAKPIQNTPITWGGWRTIFIGTTGVWLALGKYWIANEHNVAHYQNAGAAHPWQTKTRHVVQTTNRSSNQGWHDRSYATYIWHGLASHSRLIRKEQGCTIHEPPTIKEIRDGLDLNALLLQSIRVDRPWKKKIWYIFRGIYEKKQIAQ